jgi:hypothetical protein
MTARDSSEIVPSPDVIAVGAWSCAECGSSFSVSGTVVSLRSTCQCGTTVEILPVPTVPTASEEAHDGR